MQAPERLVKTATWVFAVMVVLVACNSFWFARIELPSLLAVVGGVAFGHATSVLFMLWVEADKPRR